MPVSPEQPLEIVGIKLRPDYADRLGELELDRDHARLHAVDISPCMNTPPTSHSLPHWQAV
jgi:hypothetical protein